MPPFDSLTIVQVIYREANQGNPTAEVSKEAELVRGQE